MNFPGISLFLLTILPYSLPEREAVEGSLSNCGIPIPSLPPFIRIVIIKIVLPVEGPEKAVFEMNGVKYLSFDVAKLRGEDKFGRIHTSHYQTKVSAANPTQDEVAEK